MSTSEVLIVVGPVVAAVVVATVLLMRRAGTASRFLTTTIGRSAISIEGGSRVPCGLSVRKPGRLAYGYPSCTLEIHQDALVVFGPMGARVAEFPRTSDAVMDLRRRLLWELRVKLSDGEVIVAVRDDAAQTLRGWLQRPEVSGGSDQPA